MKRFGPVFLSFAFVMMFWGNSFAACSDFVGSKDSNKYHVIDCGIAKNIKPENLVEYASVEEAVKAGKTPCGICKPPKAKQADEKPAKEKKADKAAPKADK